MMRAVDWLRLIFISPEFLWACVVLAIYIHFGDWVYLLGKRFESDSAIWKGLYGLPFVFTAVAFRVAGKVRAPMGKEENKKLYEWPGYHRIIDRVLFSLLLCLLCSVGTAILWVMSDKIDLPLLGALYLICLGVSGFSTLSLILSEHKIKEILTRYT